MCSKEENLNIKANSPQLTTSRSLWQNVVLDAAGMGVGVENNGRQGWSRQNLVHSEWQVSGS